MSGDRARKVLADIEPERADIEPEHDVSRTGWLH